MKRLETDYPPITQRIKTIIDDQFNGNVRQFALYMGLPDSAKINRLFKKDNRSGLYPTPSLDIVLLISNTFDCTTDWLMKGDESNKVINNINISSNKVKGDKNIIGNDNTANMSDKEMYDLIRSQQEQINQLIKIMSDGARGNL